MNCEKHLEGTKVASSPSISATPDCGSNRFISRSVGWITECNSLKRHRYLRRFGHQLVGHRVPSPDRQPGPQPGGFEVVCTETVERCRCDRLLEAPGKRREPIQHPVKFLGEAIPT